MNWHSSDIQAFRSPKSQMFILSLGSRGKETILFSQYMYIVVSNLLQTDGPSYILNTLHMFIVSYCWQKRFPPKEDTKMKTFKTTYGLLKWRLSLITKWKFRLLRINICSSPVQILIISKLVFVKDMTSWNKKQTLLIYFDLDMLHNFLLE